MLVNILAIVVILLIAGYYANQGLFSATLSLVAAIFASILAMGMFEPLGGMIGSYKPAYGRGITFLLVFFLGLSACRLAADFAVRKNIRFTKMIDMIAGGFVGFFAAMVIVGSCIIGVEMLPLPTVLLGASWAPAAMGFDRYPESSGMAGNDSGVAAAPRNVWFMPDRFTLAVWNGASGRGLGGSRAFADIHPDLTIESYGYRNSVQYSAMSVLPPDLLAVPSAYLTDPPAYLTQAAGKKALIVRVEVSRGTDPPKVSADEDVRFRITASQIRLVTDKGRQYYPVGNLDLGTTFKARPLDAEKFGHLVDEFAGDKVVEDWVFQIEPDEKPEWLEVKQLARVNLAEKFTDASGKFNEKPFSVLAAASYPKVQKRGSVEVTVAGAAGPIKGAKVYLVPQATNARTVKGSVQTAYDAMTEAVKQISAGSGGWASAAGKPGVPQSGEFRMWQTVARENVLLKNPTDEVLWEQVVYPMLLGACKTDGPTNIAALPRFFDSNVVPLLKANPTDLRAEGETDAKGMVELKDIAPGTYEIICSAGTSEAYYSWTASVTVKADEVTPKLLNQADHGFMLVLTKAAP